MVPQLIFLLFTLALKFSPSNCEASTPDGSLFNAFANETGPISASTFISNTELTYLGKYNSKYFYIQRINVDFKSAINGCNSLGMTLATFENNEQLNFIAETTSRTDDNAWTGGRLFQGTTSFIWEPFSEKKISTTLWIDYRDSLALTLGRWTNTKRRFGRLTTRATTEQNYYICSI